MKVEGLDKLQANIQKLAKQTVPKSVAKAINQVAKQAIRRSVKTVSKEVKALAKLIRNRVRLTKKATTQSPIARLLVNRGNLPLIRLLEDSRCRVVEHKGTIAIGQHRVQRGFIQQLKNGRVQIMQRQGKARYSIDVVKIPLATPLSNAFHNELKDYQAQVKVELTKELSHVFHR